MTPTPSFGQDVFGIAAAVNEKAISVSDLEERTKLVVFSSGLPPSEDVYRRLMPQILQGLIDEQLQLQEAEASNVQVSENELNDFLANMEKQNNLPPGGLDGYLASRGISKASLEVQVRANLAWAKLVRRKFQSQLAIGDEQIDDALSVLEASRDKPRHLVSEIFLAVDDLGSETQIRQSAERILQQIRSGGRFDQLARAFSQNAAAASGGDLGWLVAGQLDDQLERAVAAMQPGQIAGPIRTASGFHIVMLRDRRIPGGSSPDKLFMTLKQIVLPLPAAPTENDLRSRLNAARDIRRLATGCSGIDGSTLPGKPVVADIGRLKVSDLAAPLQQAVIGLYRDQISPPLRGPQGIMMLMVCDRQSIGEEEPLPSREAIADRLAREKLDLLARRYLRDLRRAAFVDVRV